MADLSKNTQVVSNSVTENVSVCPLISPDSSCDILPSDLHKEPDVDLLGDGSSLQELIDTELAFRVSGNLEQRDQDDEDDDDGLGALHCGAELPCTEAEEIYDVNTQFLMAERKSCFENLSTNATHFFTVIDEEVDADPDPDIVDGSRNGVNISAFDTIEINGSNADFEPFKSPVDMTDSQQDSSSSPISPLDADIIKYSCTFGETIVDSASEEVGDGELAEPDDDEDGLMGGPLIDKSSPHYDPTASDIRDQSPEEPSVNGVDTEVVPFQDFFTPISEYADENLDLEFQENVETSNAEMSNAEMSNAEMSNAETSNGEISNGEISNGEISNGGISNGGISNGEISNGEISNGEISNGETSNGETSNGETSNGETSNSENGIDHHVIDYCCGGIGSPGLGLAIGRLVSPDMETYPTLGFTEDIAANGAPEENGRDEFDLSVNVASLKIQEPVNLETKNDANHESDLEVPSQELLHDQSNEVDVSANTDTVSSTSCSDLESNEMVTTSASEKKIVKKKKKSEGGESTKLKKTKKTKKEEKENISVTTSYESTTLSPDTNIQTNGNSRLNTPDDLDELSNVSVKELKSSFSKFDQLSKKTVLHVRSVDTSKVQKQFNQSATAALEVTSDCRACGKQVFQMEQIKAERAVWHKNCFRCKECNKQLTVDNYNSNEGVLFCQPHFKELFKPKAVLEDDTEPPSDKPDLGLEELTALNVKSRYQVFEKTESTDSSLERSPSSVSVKRSPSILSKLARFQAKGMDIGITDEAINNIPYEESSSSSEEEPEKENEEGEKNLIRANRKQRERPMSFNKMGDIKCRWETGQTSKDERREERKQEIQNIRSRLFMGKQGKMKEMYEQAVQESERGLQKKDVDIRSEKAKSIKEKFERGEVIPDDDDDDEDAKNRTHKKCADEDLSVFEEGFSKKSRSLFLELDSKANQAPPIMSPLKSPTPREEVRKVKEISPQISKDIVRASDAVEDVKVETSEVFSKFKFFETYKEPEKEKKKFRITPPRDGQVKETSPETEIYRDPTVVRSEDKVEDEIVRTKTTSKMLSLFRQMEENASKEEIPEGPKPLKRFTPPPDYTHESEASEEEEESDEEEEEEEEEEEDRDGNPNIVRASDKVEDEFLKQAATAARAKVLRAKFERWEEKENKLNSSSSGCNLDFDQSDQPSIDSTKSLRAKFESLKNEAETPKEKSRPKVNRFVEIQTASTPLCSICKEKVYPLEKIEMSGKIFHKQCFRCLQCNCILRMETYTFNNEKLYCIPHFKQLFIAKGNYEEGFGFDQHKRKWSMTNPSNDIFNE